MFHLLFNVEYQVDQYTGNKSLTSIIQCVACASHVCYHVI